MTQRDNRRQEAEDLRSNIASKSYTSKFADESDTPPSICVVETVAEALGTDPKELGPLYEAIDPDSLDLLFESPDKFKQGCITFRFEGCHVTVDADGWVAVSPEQTTESDS